MEARRRFQEGQPVTVKTAFGEGFPATVNANLGVTLTAPPPPGADFFQTNRILSVLTGSGHECYFSEVAFNGETRALTFEITSNMIRSRRVPEDLAPSSRSAARVTYVTFEFPTESVRSIARALPAYIRVQLMPILNADFMRPYVAVDIPIVMIEGLRTRIPPPVLIEMHTTETEREVPPPVSATPALPPPVLIEMHTTDTESENDDESGLSNEQENPPSSPHPQSSEIHEESHSTATPGILNLRTESADLESQRPPRSNDPFKSLTGMLRVFGFYENPFGGFIFFLQCVVIFTILASIIWFTDLQFKYSRAAISLCVFLPILCCTIPSAVLITKVSLCQGIRGFVALPDSANVQLPEGPRVFGQFGLSLLFLVDLLCVVIYHQNLIWRLIKFNAWAYFLAVHIVSFTVILTRISLCKREITEVDALLGTPIVNRTDFGFKRERVDRLRQLETTFSSLSQGISGYMCSLLIIIPVNISVSIGIFYQWWSKNFPDEDDGAFFFAMLSLIQGLTVWILIVMCDDLNSRFRGLACTALRVYTDAHISETEGPRQRESETALRVYTDAHISETEGPRQRESERGSERGSVEVLEGLRLVEYNVRHSRAKISVFGSEVDVAMMFGVIGIHVSVVAYLTGSYISYLLPKVLK